MVVGEFDTVLERYGTRYTLENKTRMGDQIFYTFHAMGHESVLIIPRFAEQYHEVEKFCKKYFYCTRLEICKAHIKRDINKFVHVEEMPNKESSTGIMYVISAVYKDIKVNFNYMNNRMTLSDEFEIVSNNIFGNGIFVSMRNEEDEKPSAKKAKKKTSK